MNTNQTRQTNSGNFDRERFSNFVVDLRRISKSAADLKTEAKKDSRRARALIKKNLAAYGEKLGAIKRGGTKIGRRLEEKFDVSLEKLNSAAKNLKPDLLAPRLQCRPNFKWRNIFKYFNFFRRRKSLRTDELQARENIFRQALRFKSERHKAGLFRLDRGRGRESEAEPFIWYGSILYFSMVLLIIILPFKILSALDLFDFRNLEKRIASRSELGVNSLMAAADSVSRMNFKAADADFQAAGANFLEAQNDLNKINDSILTLASFSGNEKIKVAAEGKRFLAAGALVSSLGRNLVLATDSLFSGDKNNFRSSLDSFLFYGDLAVQDSKSLKQTIAKIDSQNLPEAYRPKFESLSQQVTLLSDNLDNFVSAGAKLKEVLGLSRDKRYLLGFQNNAELRASGGFLGSYALVDVRDGKIRNLEVPGGGSYDTEGGMKVTVAAPEPLWLVNPLWHFWDANWWPDWPTTAKNLAWFYEKSGGPSVDGVISVTPTVVERLLEITGPIDLTDEYGLTIDKDNFWETVQKITEQKNLAKTHPEALVGLPSTSTEIVSALPLEQDLENNSENKPKKIIGDLLAKILEALPQKLNKENLVTIITVFEENMSEKQVLFYFNDPALQAEFSARNWSGEIRSTDKDYLMVVNTNIAGQKSDRLMSEKIDLVSQAGDDGSLIDTLTITRTHNGLKNEALTGVRNVDWMRVYVPAGSELISADGFISPDSPYLQDKPDPAWEQSPLLAAENSAQSDAASETKIYTENGKTVFANWLMVDPGQSVTVVIKYRLPFEIISPEIGGSRLERWNEWLGSDSSKLYSYSLLVQKQPGASPSDFTSRLFLPDTIRVFWSFPENLSDNNGWDISMPLNSDKYYPLLLEKNKSI